MLGDFLLEFIPAIIIDQLDVHAREISLQIFLNGGGALLLNGFVGCILIVVWRDMGDELHAVHLVRRQVGVFFVKTESCSGIIDFLSVVREGETDRAILWGNRPFASALDAVHILHKVDFLRVIGPFALNMLGNDGTAHPVALLQHQHGEFQIFAGIHIVGQRADFRGEFTGFQVGILIGSQQFLESDRFGDCSAVI